MNDLYDTDILEWSERQTELLRRVAAGEAVHEPPDWQNIIGEIESVGSEQLHAVETLLLLALVNMLKADAWPLAAAVPHWRAESRLSRAQAWRRFVPSMRAKVDIVDIYRDALRGLPDTIDGQPPLPVPETCGATLDNLLSDEP